MTLLETQTALLYSRMPDDAVESLATILQHLSLARKSYRGRHFGLSHPALCDAIVAMHQRGVDTKIIIDHLQSLGHATLFQVHRMIVAGFPPENICITTSPLGQFMHLKEGAVDGDADVPDGQFATVLDAAQAGYPRIIMGSTNWTLPAFRQSNDVIIIPSKPISALAYRDFDALWAWGKAHEPSYQPSA